jgi:transposase InsO family protein
VIVKPKRSSDGIGLRSRCSGDGSRVSVVGQHCRKTYVSWSGRWLRKTRLGGEERIASELSLKLGIQVSPRTVGKYLERSRPRGSSGQRWTTFVRNHAQAIVACDFFVSVSSSFRVLYVFVAMEVSSRRILHVNVTAHPTAECTTQQLREFMAFDHPYQFLIRDRDTIFSSDLDTALNGFGIRVLKTSVRAPKADAFCERLIGTIRRECLDCLIPLQDRQGVRDPLQSRIAHIRRWDLEFWSRPQPKFRPASIGTSFPPGTASRQRRFSVGYTMNTACKRRLLSAGPNFCGLQPDYAHARI